MKGLGSGKDGPFEKAGFLYSLMRVGWRSYRAYPIATFLKRWLATATEPRSSAGASYF